ncbi:MAG TPA: TnsA-like heteromeric transposase endonuclease subunit [Trebonia sp.]
MAMSASVFDLAASFEVEFAEIIGGTRRGPLAELWSVPFERVRPVRTFPSFRGQRSFPGLYDAATMDAHVGFESWAERDVAMMLDFDPDVVGFSSQPLWLTWHQDGEERRHAPDYFARLSDGTGTVIDVKADDSIEPSDAEAFAAAERACREVGWVFRRTAGPDAMLAANVRWLAGYRHALLPHRHRVSAYRGLR